MKFRSLILLAIVGMFSFQSAIAQSEATEVATKVAKEYAAAVSMDETQMKQTRDILAEHLQTSRKNWSSSDGNMETFKQFQKETFKATDTKIVALLNEEQLAAYKMKRDELKSSALEKYMGEYLSQE